MLLFLAGTGLILWWPRKILAVNWRSPSQSINFDLHNALCVYSSIFLLIFRLTGAAIYWEHMLPKLLNLVTPSLGAPHFPRTNLQPPEDVPPLGPDELLAIAERAVPGVRPTFVQLAGDPRSLVRIWTKFPEDRTPSGQTNVFIDGNAGKVLLTQSSRTAPLTFKITKLWNREIHTGDIFGWPSRLLAFLFSLALPIIATTRPLIWWNRKRKVSCGVTRPPPAFRVDEASLASRP